MSKEDTDLHVRRGCYDAGREHQIERVCIKHDIWKGLADTKYLREN